MAPNLFNGRRPVFGRWSLSLAISAVVGLRNWITATSLGQAAFVAPPLAARVRAGPYPPCFLLSD